MNNRGMGLTKEELQGVYPFAFYYLHLMKLGAALRFSSDEIKILERVDKLDTTLVFEDLKVFANSTRYFIGIFDHIYAVLLSENQFKLFEKLVEVGKYDFFNQPTNEALRYYYHENRELIKFVVDDLTAILKSHFLSEKIKKEGAAFIKKYENDALIINEFSPFELMERARIKLSLMIFESLLIQFKEKVAPSERGKYDNIIDEATVYATGRLRERNDMREIGEKNEK